MKTLPSRLHPAQLKCTVEMGSFSDERTITISDRDATYITFADLRDVETELPPAIDQGVDGFLRVQVLLEKQDKYLVALPRDTFSSGSRIYVDKSLVKTPA